MSVKSILIGEGPLSIEDVMRLIRDPSAKVELSSSEEFRERINTIAAKIDRNNALLNWATVDILQHWTKRYGTE